MATTEGAAEAKLTGPDLVSGVDANTLADGDKLLGHANGEQVLLARVKTEYFAIGATCTHYSGPLAEGHNRPEPGIRESAPGRTRVA